MKAFELALIFVRNFSIEAVQSLFCDDTNLHCEVEQKIRYLSDNEGTGYDTYINTLRSCTFLEAGEFFTDFFDDDFIFNNAIFELMKSDPEIIDNFRNDFIIQNDLSLKQYEELVNPDTFTACTNHSINGFSEECMTEGALISSYDGVSDEDENKDNYELFGFNYLNCVKSIGNKGSETTFHSVSSPMTNSLPKIPCAFDDILNKYQEQENSMCEYIFSHTFRDNMEYGDVMVALDHIYDWDAEDTMPKSHDWGAVRVEAGWAVVEKPDYRNIEGVFGTASLLLRSKTITQDTLTLIDIGAITLKYKERSYVLDVDTSSPSIVGDDGEIEIELTLLGIQGSMEAFPDERFDLSVDQLKCKELTAEIFVGGEADFTFATGELGINLPDNERFDITLTQD